MDAKKIKPRGTRVLVELVDRPQAFAGGTLWIARVPDHEGAFPTLPREGKVIAAGPQVRNVNVGEYVISTKYNGVLLQPLNWGSRHLMLIKEEFILAAVDRPEQVRITTRSHEVHREGTGDRRWKTSIQA